MAEYIEREALLKNIDDFHHTSHIQSLTRETEEAKTLWRGIHSGVNYCRNTVIDVPAADVVEVVRCKNCEFRYTKECPQFILPLDDNGFCSYGERKE